jgi:heme/copper-type cytochrome/quinol oxidase subunit 2
MKEKRVKDTVVEENETTVTPNNENSSNDVVGTSNVESNNEGVTSSEEVETEVVDEKEQKKIKKNKILNIVETVVEAIIVVIAVVFSVFAIANPGGMNEDYSKINVNMLPVLSNSMSGTFEQGDLIFGTKAERNSEGKNETVYDIGTVIIFVVNDPTQSDQQFINTHRIVGYWYKYSIIEDEKEVFYQGYADMLGVESITSKESATKYATETLGWNSFEITNYITKGDNYEIYKTANNEDTYETVIIHDQYAVPLNNVVGTWNGGRVANLGAVITWVKTPLNFFLVIMIPLILLFGWNLFTVVKYLIDKHTEKVKVAALEEAKQSADVLSEEEKEEIKRKAIEEYMKKLQEEDNKQE